MKREAWQEVKEILYSALEIGSEQRAAFLDKRCGDDLELRREIESLIAAHSKAAERFESPAVEKMAAVVSNEVVDGMVGRSLAHYEIIEKLGAGGMGEVYLARDTVLNRKVALKVLPLFFTQHPDRLRRFQQEARAASTLNHPNILTIHEVGHLDSTHYLATEFVEGESLRDRINRAPLKITEALDIATQIASALAAAHEAGIVHRDIKPENIMLRRDGIVKVVDFGLAKLTPAVSESEASTMVNTEEGIVIGTAQYMSPEQARGLRVDARTDIWSFGCVLYEMLARCAPFKAPTTGDLIVYILEREPPPLTRLTPEIPPELGRIVKKSLRKERDERYQTGKELLDGLNALKRAPDRSTMTHRQYRRAGAAVLAILLISALGVWTYVRRAQSETSRRAAVAEVERLVDLGLFVDVWRVGTAALQHWPNDPQLEHSMRAASDLVTIATDPPGADVAFKAYDNISAEWIPLGTTPLENVRAPLGQLRWRITKDGFEPLEARLEVGAPSAAAGRPDVNARPIQLRPVGSEFGRMVFVPGGNEGVELTDYWIDQTEVTNREFKEFIDRGGYQNPQLWTNLRRERSQLPGDEVDGAMFLDRTGRPGPATWELGSYPEGQDDHPVSGVSWFEAAAYCESVGKTLPTVYHWKKALGVSFFIEVLMIGNFNGRGPEATTQLKEVGPFGTYGMAGNVKEWVWNELEGKRYILGGAWNEPVYMATYNDVRPPLDRAETHGCRCVKENAPSGAMVYAPYGAGLPPSRDPSKEKPVGAAEFDIFRRFYSYDRTPLDPRIERIEEAEYWRRERVSFAAAYGGERVLANILIPKNATPPYQAVIWFPGGYTLDLKSSDGDLVFSHYFDFLPRSGRALVFPVYKGTYERQLPGGRKSLNIKDIVVQWSKDLGRTVDYLETRGDFARDKLAYYGYSMGADEAVPAVAFETRFKAAILLTGGLNRWQVRSPEIEPLNFLPRIKVPVLLMGGRNDFYYPVEESQAPLFRLLGTSAEHKRHVIFEGAGHVPPRIELIRETLSWLDRYLGPVSK
jgi:eukaryotic-like serine/threonine-protein kinase